MAKKPPDPKKEAMNRLLWELLTEATRLAMTKAPANERWRAFAKLCRKSADEADALAESGTN